MKPNEGYEIGQGELIDQLRLLILEGRTTQDVKSNINDCINCNDDLLHQRKINFLSFWKTCDSMYIEVWLYHHDQFNENEAMNGHDGYLLIEQWQLEIKLNKSVEHGLHCTEKMLIQAIKSKLYFSQLSAWLSLTKGKFPRQTYFRLCQLEKKTALKRFIRAPDFHQFPRVITPTKELIVSLYSLQHSDILLDYPIFSWVLTDLPNETPQGKSAKKLMSNSERGSLVRNDCSSHGESQHQDYASDPSHVVRKLQFGDLSSVEKKASDQQQTTFMDKTSSFESSKDVNKRPSKYFFKEQNLRPEKEGKLLLKEKKDDLHFDFRKSVISSSSPEGHQLFCEEMRSSEVQVKAAKSSLPNSDIGEYFSSLAQGKSTLKDINDSAKKCYSTSNVSPPAEEQMYDGGMCEVMQHIGADDEISSLCRKNDASIFTSKRSQECERNFTSIAKQCFHNSGNSQMFETNSECRNEHISRTSLLTCDISDDGGRTNLNVLGCPHNAKNSNRKINDDLNCEQMRMCEDKKLKKIRQIEIDRPRLKTKSLEARNIDEKIKKSWAVDEYGNVLHRTTKETKNILPGVRHVIDEECQKKMNERLRKCCLSNDGCCKKEQALCKKKLLGETNKSGMNEENIFSEQKYRAIPTRKSSISRHHFRHASTGTLPVFHPSTGLPMSSSPAPFRKTSQKQAVDDICSPCRQPTNLSHQCCNLSKSAPTLTTQSLLVNFEESVLNDRLLPDGVVEGFTAELSASGSKKCLPHVTLPVQAYFFKLSDDNAPSPYMGYISLDVPGLPKKGYHVPKKGTIQLTLFNPNRTVVKIFVVLYNFSDMQPNFQTFLRQKTTSLVKSDELVDRIHDNLHYLIHLRFVSSKSGRIYLHTDIRVIFARHPPDQVHLRTTTSGPTNPKYVPRQDMQEEF